MRVLVLRRQHENLKNIFFGLRVELRIEIGGHDQLQIGN